MWHDHGLNMLSFQGSLKAPINLVREVFIIIVMGEVPGIDYLLLPNLHVRLILFDSLLALCPSLCNLHQKVSLLRIEGLSSLLAF